MLAKVGSLLEIILDLNSRIIADEVCMLVKMKVSKPKVTMLHIRRPLFGQAVTGSGNAKSFSIKLISVV